MKVKCPYCSCHYDIRPEVLGDPVGNERLGFGWWLRCYQCHRKFWLSSTNVINMSMSPIKADRQRKIDSISKLTQSKKSKNKLHKHKYKPNIIHYVILSILLIVGGIAYYKQDIIKSFFVQRLINIRKSTVTSLQLTNISYRIETVENKNKIYVTGFIVNNTSSIMSINGLQVTLYSKNKEMTSWQIEPDAKSIIPGDKIFFSSEKILDNIYPDLKVGVNIL